MTLHDMQQSVRSNSEELQDYLKDLKHWEEDIKKDDLNLKKSKKSNVKEMNLESNEDNRITKLGTEGLSVSNSGNYEKDHLPIVSDNHKGKAETLKEEGNKLYAQGKYNDALAKYTQGIGLDPSNKFLPANRAMTLIKLGKFKAAEKDCTKTLTLDPNYIKAYLRRATARAKTSNVLGAIEDYEKSLELEPWNKTTRKELEKLKEEYVQDKDIPPLEDSPLVLKKMNLKKTQDVKSKEEDKIKDYDKIPESHESRSQKPIVKVSVEKVSSREELEKLLNNCESKESSNKTSEIIAPDIEKVEKLRDLSNLETLEVANAPKTSHQFSQDWRKVTKSKEVTHSYLKKIPVSFFHGIEIEVELLIEIFSVLCDEDFSNEEAALITESLMQTIGFSINMAFLDQKQKEEISSLMKKLERSENSMEIAKQLGYLIK